MVSMLNVPFCYSDPNKTAVAVNSINLRPPKPAKKLPIDKTVMFSRHMFFDRGSHYTP